VEVVYKEKNFDNAQMQTLADTVFISKAQILERVSIDNLLRLPLEEREGRKVLHGLYSKPSKSTGAAQPRASSLHQG